jgi:hypothetical protein
VQKVRVDYLGANNLYRRVWGIIEPEFPTLVRVKKTPKMRHTMEDDPVVTLTKPIRLESYQELLDMPSPHVLPKTTDHQGILVEENSFYPIGTTNDLVNHELRDSSRLALYAQSVQQARGRAARRNDADTMTSIWSLLFVGVIGVMTAIIAFIAISLRLSS